MRNDFQTLIDRTRSRPPLYCQRRPTSCCNHADENYSDVWEIWAASWILLSSAPLCIPSSNSHIPQQWSVVAALLLEGDFAVFLSLMGGILVMNLLIFSMNFCCSNVEACWKINNTPNSHSKCNSQPLLSMAIRVRETMSVISQFCFPCSLR